MNWRCRHGIHRWTTIPENLRAAGRAAGLPRPHGYVGRQVPPYCERCGVQRYGEPPPLWEGPVHFHMRDCEGRGRTAAEPHNE